MKVVSVLSEEESWKAVSDINVMTLMEAMYFFLDFASWPCLSTLVCPCPTLTNRTGTQ